MAINPATHETGVEEFKSATVRGDVRRGDQVMVDLPEIGEPPAEGQIVAESDDGSMVIVSIYDGTVEREVERRRVWRNDGYDIEEL